MPNGAKEYIQFVSDNLLTIIAAVFLALFAIVWLWIARELYTFDPTPAQPKLELSAALVSTGGVLASTVGAGTAAVLGIEIQKATAKSLSVMSSLSASPLVIMGVLLYLVIGVVNLLVWLGNSDEANDLIAAFGLGALGWIAGAFSAIFRAQK